MLYCRFQKPIMKIFTASVLHIAMKNTMLLIHKIQWSLMVRTHYIWNLLSKTNMVTGKLKIIYRRATLHLHVKSQKMSPRKYKEMTEKLTLKVPEMVVTKPKTVPR